MEPHMCVYLRTKFQVYGTILTIFTKEWVGGGANCTPPHLKRTLKSAPRLELRNHDQFLCLKNLK